MALYKHSGLSKGSKSFEWFSKDPDPLVSNPYPTGYEELSFTTEDASETEVAFFEDSEKLQLERAKKNKGKTDLADAVKKIKDPDVVAAIKALIDALGIK